MRPNSTLSGVHSSGRVLRAAVHYCGLLHGHLCAALEEDAGEAEEAEAERRLLHRAGHRSQRDGADGVQAPAARRDDSQATSDELFSKGWRLQLSFMPSGLFYLNFSMVGKGQLAN